jgi:hypothetical protein
MKMSRTILVAIFVIFVAQIFIGCGKTRVAGTYVNQDNPSEYLELKPEGTFYLKEAGMGFTGKWELKGNEIRISWEGFVLTGEIKGNK